MSPPPGGWPSPAKLNLFLHIVGRRADGYHELQTVYQFLDHSDRVFVEARGDGRVERAKDLPGVPAEQDLALRAARALQTRAPRGAGCTLRVDKRLPLGAGLGGGSSNAATVLVALNRLWNLHLPDAELAGIGLALGADVPVFVHGVAAWAEGVGERLTPVSPPEPWYLVATPPCAVSTREMYAAADLVRDTPRIRLDEWRAGRAASRNDFEPVVRRRYPPVAAVLDRLAATGAQPRLSGSGASVFAPFADRTAADAARAALPEGTGAFVARGCNRSPLALALAAAHGP